MRSRFLPDLRWRPWSIGLATLLLSACGGGGSGGTDTAPPSSGLPNQDGCHYRYTLTNAPVLTGADPLLAQQWHLDNTGQFGGTAGEDVRAFAAWSRTKGLGARIAVVDDALETLHQDLAPNVVSGGSYSYRPASLASTYPLPCVSDDDHGTSVAGIAAARDGNALGGAGVAPRAALVGYSALATGYDADLADALNRGLAENGVYNNSWGSPDDGRPNRADATFAAAIERGIATGRGGRGAVYVFPGGNGGCFAVDAARQCQSETAGLDGYLNQRGVVVACSVDHRGRHPSYAEPGANLLVCAPSSGSDDPVGVTTTAVQNAYRSDFGGTSASVPMVSGVAALILAANPNLTWRDVRWILASSARRNDPADAGWVGSRFGPAFNHKYGFGVANAQAAVDMALGWTSVGGLSSLKECGPYVRNPNITLPDARGLLLSPQQDTVQVPSDQCAITQIEYVEVAFTASHTYSGDLRIRLISPNGLVSELVNERLCEGSGDACGAYDDWRFGSVRHLGEPAAGDWRLQVTDASQDDTGVWQNWSLRLWGR